MKRALYWLTLLIAALVVGYYAGTVLWYAYDFPYMDDYPVVVDFLNRLPAATSVGEKVALLMEQNNFHRLVLAKGLAWANVLLTGSVDFRVLQYVGLLFLLLTAWLLWRSTEAPASVVSNTSLTTEAGASVLPSLPVLFLLFQFQGWNIAFWSIVAVSNVGAPALALLAFFLANRQREGWAVVVGLVALFTNGNGILVLPLLAVCWALQLRWRWVLATAAVTIPALLFYFQNYQNPAGSAISALFSPAKIGHPLALDTAFLGALVYHPAVPWLPILLGILTIIWTIYLLRIRFDRQNPTLFWLLIFLHLSGLMLAVNRIQNDTSIVFASRYRNITALHMAAVYLTMVAVLVRYNARWQSRRAVNWFVGTATLATAGLWLVSNITYHSKIVRFQELKQTDNLLWQRYGQIRASAPQYRPVQHLQQLALRGIFKPETASLASLQSRPVVIVPTATPGDSLVYGIDIQLIDAGYLVISGWAKVAGRKANFNDTFVGIQTPAGWQYYTTLFHQRLDKADSANDKDTGFTAIIPYKGTMPTVAIFVKSGRSSALHLCQPSASFQPVGAANAFHGKTSGRF
ncbi:hypothetical protein [Fibrella aquatilis]|uniref:Uncharacterized protein n=1 Tax=Fibrella aquatilis TaxID=2817059 RepID=A0A939K004_9BACT|nr:hypothetical protein [Fibrella aquatilis]MBO0930730.1 hypothetical protein [Fibrella aquatilis]